MESVKDRIVKIMESLRLSPSRFAEEIGVQRATISHITTERNRPSSNVLSKIMARYPEIEPEWLLNGNGQMMRNDSGGNVSVTLDKEGAQPDLFTTRPVITEPSSEKKRIERTEMQVKNMYTSGKRVHKEETTVSDGYEKELPDRRIERITVFYSDNTYETFVPEKKH